jgi:hypothetical protein
MNDWWPLSRDFNPVSPSFRAARKIARRWHFISTTNEKIEQSNKVNPSIGKVNYVPLQDIRKVSSNKRTMLWTRCCSVLKPVLMAAGYIVYCRGILRFLVLLYAPTLICQRAKLVTPCLLPSRGTQIQRRLRIRQKTLDLFRRSGSLSSG